jgi:hypothetical protein
VKAGRYLRDVSEGTYSMNPDYPQYELILGRTKDYPELRRFIEEHRRKKRPAPKKGWRTGSTSKAVDVLKAEYANARNFRVKEVQDKLIKLLGDDKVSDATVYNAMGNLSKEGYRVEKQAPGTYRITPPRNS